jgi:hypothetical protein
MRSHGHTQQLDSASAELSPRFHAPQANQRCEAAIADATKPAAAAEHARATATAAQAKLARARQQADEQAAEHSAALAGVQQRAAAEADAQRQAEAAAESQQAGSEADAQRGRVELACRVMMHMCWVGNDRSLLQIEASDALLCNTTVQVMRCFLQLHQLFAQGL